MPYNKFTFKEVVEKFDLQVKTVESVFEGKIEPISPSKMLYEFLKKNTALATAIATEKVLSELIVAPILVEIRELANQQISLFSGIEFKVDLKQGLSGRCDFILSLNDNQYFLTAPVVTIVEAKKSDISLGLGQCIAEMVAAQLFNQKEGVERKQIYGIVTTGLDWQILALTDKTVSIETKILNLSNVEEILGVLLKMVEKH